MAGRLRKKKKEKKKEENTSNSWREGLVPFPTRLEVARLSPILDLENMVETIASM